MKTLPLLLLLFVCPLTLGSDLAFKGHGSDIPVLRVSVPHDAYPGYSITRLNYRGQAFSLLENEFSCLFAILSDGLLMPTGDISHLADSPPLTLVVKEDSVNGTKEQMVVVHVVDRNRLVRFTQDAYSGSVYENEPVGTVIEGLDRLFATSDPHHPMVYTFVSGNEGDAFSIVQPVTNLSTPILVRTNKILDREEQEVYDLVIRATDVEEANSADATLTITVDNLNDNAPVPDRTVYEFRIPEDLELYSIVGNVSAFDADGDKPVYHLVSRHPVFAIIPKTGQILLIATPELKTYKLSVRTQDTAKPPRVSAPFSVYVEVYSEELLPEEEADLSNEIVPVRQKRSVRPTKSYEYKETDGSKPGKVMFQLDKKHPQESYKMEGPVKWVEVDSSGDVKVKEPWDYEQLGKEKTIDFWVFVTGPNINDPERQRVIIHLKDVNDEPPYFINRPLPMQAVVQLNAPPGTPVFKLQARDPDTDHNIHYFLVRDRTGGRFEVDERSGEVRTLGSDPFMLDKEYVLYVKAEDHNGMTEDRQHQSTGEERLSIMGGKRPPQFYMQKYEATIPENQRKDSDIIEVKAKSFADREIRYTLRAQGKGAGTFNIGPTTGVVKLAKDLDYEDLRQPKSYSLIVTATEDSGGFSTSVELTIKVTDVNDNAPRFELPDYQAHNVDEDVAVGTSILQVSASDMDQGKNAEIEYSLDKDDFTIDNKGIIYSNKRLDADINNTYVLTVRATDRGDPPLTGTATVRIYTENKNDEPPKFSQDVYTPNVDENAGPNTLVTTVVASDKDGDNIYFGFVGGGTVSGMFQIEERTGVIRLISGHIQLDKDKYELNVTARDDGACCKNGALTTHTSTALVVVFITDVNDNKPLFEECATYAPQVEEGAPSGTMVIKVKAVDNDKGHNGQVRYSIVQQPNQKGTKFIVDEITGDIRTNKVFDREGDDGRFVSVTVKATDRGNPPLEGVCSFKVEITDINDNPPLFDRQEYRENVKQDTPKGTNILRVSASDEDADNNGAIVYNLTAPYDPTDLDYFEINPDSGWISLKKALDRDQYHLRAIALDKGLPQHRATVEVIIDVVDRANNPPIWDQPVYGPIFIKENYMVGQVVASIKARSGIPDNPTVFYTLMKGSTEQTNKKDTFYLDQRNMNGDTWADIQVNYPLDYERIQQYNLTVRVENNGIQQLASEATVYIVLEDVNDEIPLFIEREQETVLEGMPPNTKVTQVQAVDKDGTYPNNKVYYAIESKDHGDKFFSIDRETGEIYTRVEFDREEKQAYAILVRAEDGAASDRPNMKPGEPNSVTKYIRIGIGDKNDNPPYFDQALYEAEVNEDEDIQHTVITVTAKDKDESSRIRYEITQGNIGGAFAVKNETGAIYVAGPLDYESRKEYKLTLVASDTLMESSTLVHVKINDINDLPPKFEQPSYITTILEEDTEGMPKSVLKVTATDGDRDRKPDIVYFLTGQGVDDQDPANSKFAINTTTGEIYVLKPLDRDLPHGRSQWRFTVFAEDEGGNGLVGYADVLVNLKDINDNAPFFPYAIYTGNVTENGTAGMTVMTMTATDYDDPNEGTNARLKYSIEQNQVNENGELIFTIDEETGVISTAVCCLDRETNPEYTIKVVAMDGGGLKGTGTATIKIKDINDMPPEFTKKEWQVEVDETEGDNIPETPILVVSVNDGDLLETNRFSYKVIDNAFGADKFTMVTNSDGTGSLKIAKPLDFEDLQQRFGFNITIQVSDHGGESSEPYHVDYAKVRVRLRDINDNKPEFEKPNIEVIVKEDADIGTSLATFRATDADQGGKSRVSYTIDRSSDKKRQFRIDQNGVVRIQRTLDREETPRHQVKILAIDDGAPPRTATATLTVVVSDINDNAPRFLRDYRPVIMEHSPPQKVEEILATDDDDRSKGNGPPFTFRMDPNAPDIIKQFFDVQHDPTGANGDGMAIVTSKERFDREQQKEYLVPIVIKDSGTPSMTGTSTLTVIIGDVNDNRMHPGSKSIFVYNFKGESPPTPIGRVHVEDLDDWDLPDKSFYWENNIAHTNFEVDKDTGLIVMKNVTSGGTYFLRFVVHDRVHTQEVSANVSVTVKEIPEEAIFNSGSIRISGISAEDFVRVWNWTENRQVKSKYHKFRDMISSLTSTRRDNVDIFSVILKQERPPITDVRFAAHRSPYFKASMLNGIVALNRELIEQEVGINITMVGIDECLFENLNCETSCTNALMVDRQPIVVNANRTSFVGVNTWVQPRCVCGARDFSEIETCRKRPQPCYNGGRCFESYGGVSCKCPEGFEGPQCQLTTRSFDGRGWAWFPPLQQCERSHLSLEFMTRKPDGLLLYNGPIANPDVGEVAPQDFISLELQSGRPRLLVDFGSGTAEVVVFVDESLSDGEWHQVDIFWDRETIRLVIDNCQKAKIEDSDPPKINRSRCETKSNIPPFNEFLNVNTPLQLGGVHHQYLTDYRWQHQHTREGFEGCIKNVIHNSEMYDLGNPGSSAASSPGCKPAEDACNSNSVTRHCEHGTCVGTYNSAKCICYPGYFGTRCDKETISKMFQQNSYIKYALSFEPDPYRTDIQLQFRTRQKHGELFRATSKHGREYCILEIRDKKLRLRFNLNHLRSADEHELWLPNVQVSDGQWHTVRVLRHGSTASLSLDGGGGRRYNELLEYEGQHQLMMIEKQNVIAGGDVQYVGPGVTVVDNDFQEGCMNDIRLDQRYLPMENGSENAAVLEWRNLINKCPSNNPCQGIICPKPFICLDLWMLHECRCPEGFTITEDGKNCTDANECLSEPCLNGGSCVNLPDGEGYYCVCPDGFGGLFCGARHEEKVMRLSMAALAAILICLLNILILVLVIVAYTRNRRPNQKYGHGDVDDDVRENIISYDDEGGGEDDMNAYDITPLRIPIDATGTPLGAKPGPEKPPIKEPRQRQIPPGDGGVGEFIRDHLDKADHDPNAPPFDDLRNYAYEGCGSTAGSLSSLASTAAEDNDQDFDYLNGWGPRFQKLADMYGPGDSEED
ncbi:neural-cadherin-like isoform X5 [Argiope bruennichi]|uniref:neural-cadherin-like isoform X5 n=1 Tax=Argiope bruennichi TaxID=94029 RepID=UPI00249438B2|nr:neural-cadherin-like isoform X5 [Argiope bruennichi]